jgi:hypothetical protein
MLTASATDDGLPQRRRGGVMVSSSLSIRWIHYRGSGHVTIEMPSTSTSGNKSAEITTNVKFDAPGVYVLRAIASDGQIEAHHDVTVTVK